MDAFTFAAAVIGMVEEWDRILATLEKYTHPQQKKLHVNAPVTLPDFKLLSKEVPRFSNYTKTKVVESKEDCLGMLRLLFKQAEEVSNWEFYWSWGTDTCLDHGVNTMTAPLPYIKTPSPQPVSLQEGKILKVTTYEKGDRACQVICFSTIVS